MLFSNLNHKTIVIAIVYILLIAGGLWHALNVFEREMRLLASPIIICLSLLLFFDYFRILRSEQKHSEFNANSASNNHVSQTRTNHSIRNLLIWSLLVLSGGFLIELVGVNTGVIFGSYHYKDILWPTISQVPLVIGFAWYSMIICSAALALRLLKGHRVTKPFVIAMIIALCMIVFDSLLEPAATKLNYWHWENNAVPFRNYLSWFIVGFVFSYLALRLGLFAKKVSQVAFHAYFAQLFYFSIVNLSK